MDDAFSDSDTKRQAARKMQTLPQTQNQSDSSKSRTPVAAKLT
jgi:hypothetical protein